MGGNGLVGHWRVRNGDTNEFQKMRNDKSSISAGRTDGMTDSRVIRLVSGRGGEPMAMPRSRQDRQFSSLARNQPHYPLEDPITQRSSSEINKRVRIRIIRFLLPMPWKSYSLKFSMISIYH